MQLPAEGPAVADGRGRLAAGGAPRGVRLHVGRLHPGGLQGEVPAAGGHADRVVERQAGLAPLHLAGQGPGGAHRFGQGVAAHAVGHGDQGVGRAGVVGEAGPAEDGAGADRLGNPSFERGPDGGPGQVAVPFRGG